jgi:hypothetical protein
LLLLTDRSEMAFQHLSLSTVAKQRYLTVF